MSRHIDADELIGFFDSYPDHIEFDVEDIKSIINEQDTADVRENVRGEWIDCGIHGDWAWEQDGHGNSWHIWKCSKCEYKTEHRNNYCPNCGAEMRGDKKMSNFKEKPKAKNVYYEEHYHTEFKCSLCGATIDCVEGGSMDGAKFNYCPWCGAEMEEEPEI